LLKRSSLSYSSLAPLVITLLEAPQKLVQDSAHGSHGLPVQSCGAPLPSAQRCEQTRIAEVRSDDACDLLRIDKVAALRVGFQTLSGSKAQARGGQQTTQTGRRHEPGQEYYVKLLHGLSRPEQRKGLHVRYGIGFRTDVRSGSQPSYHPGLSGVGVSLPCRGRGGVN
jgi:hypothetical protein